MEWKIAEKLARGGLLEPGAESFMINTANHNFDINTTSIYPVGWKHYILTDPIKTIFIVFYCEVWMLYKWFEPEKDMIIRCLLRLLCWHAIDVKIKELYTKRTTLDTWYPRPPYPCPAKSDETTDNLLCNFASLVFTELTSFFGCLATDWADFYLLNSAINCTIHIFSLHISSGWRS